MDSFLDAIKVTPSLQVIDISQNNLEPNEVQKFVKTI